MPTAFTEKERRLIQRELIDAAFEFAATRGMKKTTVEELSEKAGISKGAFYKFYNSKEELFFDAIEEAHAELYAAAENVLKKRNDLTAAKRVAKAIIAMFEYIEKNSFLPFLENDVPVIMRKIPEERVSQHNKKDLEQIKTLVDSYDINLNVSFDLAMSVLSSISYASMHRKQIGPNADRALLLLVESACEKIIKQ